MAKKRTSRSSQDQIYRCMIGFTFWKGERILMGQEITVTGDDMKNRGLRNKLKTSFQPVGSVTVTSEPIQIIDEEKE